MKVRKHKIIAVEKGSPADIAGMTAGDFVTALNGSAVRDVFDYRTGITEERIVITAELADGTVKDFVLFKDEYEDPGLEFESYLMDKEKVCKNKCIFCFVDQLPGDARKTLRFKDDDLRLSFLTGNFVTLTNTDDAELDRLISYRLSPMNISVHATEPELRVQMLGNPKAGDIMRQLRKIADAGIRINTQIVLCPGINDGAALERSLDDLAGLGENLESIALVPVGLTKHRGGKELVHITPFGRATAAKVIQLVTNRQQMYHSKFGRRLVFAADELYIKAGMKMPEAKSYEEFYQLENGVGLIPLFLDDFRRGVVKRKRKRKKPAGQEDPLVLITGTDAYPFIEGIAKELTELYNSEFRVLPVINKFFGETVTVAGLVTGSDVLRVLDEESISDSSTVILPEIMLRDSGDKFLDDMTTDEFAVKADREIMFVPSDAEGFLSALDNSLK